MYLANKYHQILDNIQAQALLNQWVIFANSTLSMGLFLEDRREREIPVLLTPLNEIFTQQSFLMGDNLTVADIAVGSYLYYAQKLLNLDYQDYPNVVIYLNNLSERNAYELPRPSIRRGSSLDFSLP